MATDARPVSDEALAAAISAFTGLAGRVVTDPSRWTGSEDVGTGAAVGRLGSGRVARLVDRSALGPVSSGWAVQPLDVRVNWWAQRLGAVGGLVAALPRTGGSLADRVPVSALVGAAARGVAVCAVLHERAVPAGTAWDRTVASVVFERDDLPWPDAEVRSAVDVPEGAVAALKQLAGILSSVVAALPEQPRLGGLRRMAARAPGIGAVSGWLEERDRIVAAAKAAAAHPCVDRSS